MATTVPDLRRFKVEGQKFAMLTAYDVMTARIFDEAGVPLLLVGDTLGIMVLGYETTLPVTMDDMVRHCQAVRRGAPHALVVGDLPFGAYETSVEDGLRNSVRLLKEGGAAMVKLEGPELELIAALSAKGIPVMGHLGLTPQSFHAFGGNRVQARTEEAADHLLADARAIEAAGAAALVLEAVPNEVARRVTESLSIPTIGIGAGPDCDGQVLVSTDMLGINTGPAPRFAKRYAELHTAIAEASRSFIDEVAQGTYPGPEHSYDWPLRSSTPADHPA